MSNPKSSPTTTCQEQPNFSSNSICKHYVFKLSNKIKNLKQINDREWDDLHEVSNVRGSPCELLQRVHRNVDHIFLDRKVHNCLLLSFPGELFKTVLWFTCISFAMLDFTVIGHEVGRLFMLGWVISFCKFEGKDYVVISVESWVESLQEYILPSKMDWMGPAVELRIQPGHFKKRSRKTAFSQVIVGQIGDLVVVAHCCFAICHIFC